MNPLINHPILSGLPYKDLKNPTYEGIQFYLKKRRKTGKIMEWCSIVCIIGSFVIVILDNNLTGLSLSLIAVYQLSRSFDMQEKYQMTDDEIKRAIESVNNPIKVIQNNNPDSYKWIDQADKHWG